jgi:hypothetical protein
MAQGHEQLPQTEVRPVAGRLRVASVLDSDNCFLDLPRVQVGDFGSGGSNDEGATRPFEVAPLARDCEAEEESADRLFGE